MSRWPGCTLRCLVSSSATFLLLTAAGRHASAYHDEEQHVTDESAYTLRDKDFRVGIWKLQYGVIDQVTVGTYIWPWLFRVSNLHVKWRFWHDETWAFSAFTGFYHFDTKHLDEVDEDTGNATIDVVPFELAASYRFNERYTLSVAPVWTTVALEGHLENEDLRGAGEGAVNNFQLTATFEWRLTRVTALLFHGRYLVAQTAHAQGEVVLHPDEFTTVEVHAAGKTDALDFRRAGSLVISSVFSWEHFNLRAGLSFGNYNVPGVNFVIGEALVIPDFDMYWIF
jgi:hypothetical protein